MALPLAAVGGAGTLQDQGDGRTGWNTLAAKGTWRPQGVGGAHIVDFGVGRDAYKLGIQKTNVLGSWLDGAAVFAGQQRRRPHRNLQRLGAGQLALRAEVEDGAGPALRRLEGAPTASPPPPPARRPTQARSESDVSPKAALAYQLADDTVLKASVGRAVRYPTVGELYGATSGGALSFINDPNLRPEKSWTGELSAEKDLGDGLARATLFHETTRDALYNQLIPNSTVSRVQNIDKVRTTGFELSYTGQDVLMRGLDLGGSLTYANSKIVANAAFPAAVGKWQPRVPRWRSTVFATLPAGRALGVHRRRALQRQAVLEPGQQRCKRLRVLRRQPSTSPSTCACATR